MRVFVVFQSIFCVVCCNMFLSTAAVHLIVVYLFDTIVIETPSVLWISNLSRVFVQIFDFMEDLWIHVLNRTNKNELEFVRVACKHLDYISLKLIEYQRLVELWSV